MTLARLGLAAALALCLACAALAGWAAWRSRAAAATGAASAGQEYCLWAAWQGGPHFGLEQSPGPNARPLHLARSGRWRVCVTIP